MFAVLVPNLPDEQELIPTWELNGITNRRAFTQQLVTIFAEGG